MLPTDCTGRDRTVLWGREDGMQPLLYQIQKCALFKPFNGTN